MIFGDDLMIKWTVERWTNGRESKLIEGKQMGVSDS